LRVGDGSFTDSDKEAADTLCTYFHKVFTSDDAQSMILNEPNQVELSITFDTHVVLLKLQQLKADRSPGPDGIHPAVLKHCADAVSIPLSMIFQTCYSTGCVPTDWRLANITVLHCSRKGQSQIPVSLTIDQYSSG